MGSTAKQVHDDPEGWWTRDHALIVVLVAATALLLFFCWQLVHPFLTPIAWALALAVVAHPLHGWIARRIKHPGIAAGVAVFVIALVLVALASFVAHSILKEAAAWRPGNSGRPGDWSVADATCGQSLARRRAHGLGTAS